MTTEQGEHTMDRKICILVGIWLVFAVLSLPAPVLANKTSVRIDAPLSAAVGEEITIHLQVSHEGNNFVHYTDLVTVVINGEEFQRWEFSNFDKPEAETFTRTITYKVTGKTEIKADGNCNMHGSAGPDTVTVNAK